MDQNLRNPCFILSHSHIESSCGNALADRSSGRLPCFGSTTPAEFRPFPHGSQDTADSAKSFEPSKRTSKRGQNVLKAYLPCLGIGIPKCLQHHDRGGHVALILPRLRQHIRDVLLHDIHHTAEVLAGQVLQPPEEELLGVLVKLINVLVVLIEAIANVGGSIKGDRGNLLGLVVWGLLCHFLGICQVSQKVRI